MRVRATEAQIKVPLLGCVDVGMAHVVAVAQEGHGFACDGAAMFFKGLNVRQ